MAITVPTNGVGSFASGTANLTPVIPTGAASGDLMLCFYGTKPYDDAPTINQSWTDYGNATNGTTGSSIDGGSMQVRVFYKIHGATEANPTITNTTNSVSGAVIIVFRKDTGYDWAAVAGDGGGDTSSGTGFSATAGSNPGITAGDVLVGFAAMPTDAVTALSSITITATGITPGTFQHQPATDLSTSSGQDMAMGGGYVSVDSGTASAAPVFAATLDASTTGTAYIIRLRQTAGTTTLTQSSRFDNSQAFYSHTLTPGAVALTQSSRFDNSGAFYSHTLTAGAVTLAQSSRYDNSGTFYQHSASAGIELTAARYDNSQTWYQHAASGAVDLKVYWFVFDTKRPSIQALTQTARFDNAFTCYDHALAAVANLGQSSRFDNSQTFSDHALTATIDLAQSARLENTQSFGIHALSTTVDLAPAARFDNANTFGSHAISTAIMLQQDQRHENAQSWYVHNAESPITLLASRFDNEQLFYPASISGYFEQPSTITPSEREMLTDIWQRFGLDSSAPLTETSGYASFGNIVISKSGESAVTSVRAGSSSHGDVSRMIADIWRRLGLDAENPMNASSDSITAGFLSQTIVPTSGGVIVTRTDGD